MLIQVMIENDRCNSQNVAAADAKAGSKNAKELGHNEIEANKVPHQTTKRIIIIFKI